MFRSTLRLTAVCLAVLVVQPATAGNPVHARQERHIKADAEAFEMALLAARMCRPAPGRPVADPVFCAEARAVWRMTSTGKNCPTATAGATPEAREVCAWLRGPQDDAGN